MNLSNVKAANSRSHESICACSECCIEFGFVSWNLMFHGRKSRHICRYQKLPQNSVLQEDKGRERIE
ncbi:CLUMA_CG013430, isoform A [Clunio marinus]|uniref:CLUMA_CG013430, isoform A n=1 Tax=Clunio marinus TaxID=568069 RepID=A0A1J1IK70_9DIPT|nr:CLUMA_CG013430, isoform A [Clunio marinus]